MIRGNIQNMFATNIIIIIITILLEFTYKINE